MVIGATSRRCFGGASRRGGRMGGVRRCYIVDMAVDVADVTEFDLQPTAGSKSEVKSKPKSERARKGPQVVLFAKVKLTFLKSRTKVK